MLPDFSSNFALKFIRIQFIFLNTLNMKQFFFLLLGLSLALAACTGVDETLMADMQSTLQAHQGNSAPVEAAGKQVNDFIASMETMEPEAFRISERFVQFYENGLRIRDKYQATVAGYTDLQHRLDSLMDAYNSGKVKTEAVKLEFANVAQGLNGMKDLFGRIGGRAVDMSKELSNMQAEYAANPGAFPVSTAPLTGPKPATLMPGGGKSDAAPANGQGSLQAVNPAAVRPGAGKAGLSATPPAERPKQ